ncbi:MAG: type II toxin-antitoxin system PemK/MazF family toxin [Phycisphaeraceae bacterium]
MAKTFVPERGDVVWLAFDQSPKGHEQAGHRPALVLSPRSYNAKSKLCIACPITSRTAKTWPFLVSLPDHGAVIADQVRCVDWKARKAKPKGKADPAVVQRVTALISRLIEPSD